MARKCIINRNNKVLKLVNKFADIRKELKSKIKKARFDSDFKKEVMYNTNKIDSLPKNSSNVKFRNRCKITNRARGLSHFGIFGMSGFKIREKANNGDLLGLKKC